MSFDEQLGQDLKTALLAGDKLRVSTIRSLKSALLYAEVAAGQREIGLNEAERMGVLAKEAKKRQESADAYTVAGNPARAESELAEKAIIAAYLPAAPSTAQLQSLIEAAIIQVGGANPSNMGQIIKLVKQQAGAAADGAAIARLTKERLAR